jgi:predicted  nucleic acid-binding Zn-ribbon protein
MDLEKQTAKDRREELNRELKKFEDSLLVLQALIEDAVRDASQKRDAN